MLITDNNLIELMLHFGIFLPLKKSFGDNSIEIFAMKANLQTIMRTGDSGKM